MIQKLADQNCRAICKNPVLYLVFLLVLTAITGFYYFTLPTETSLESLLFEEDSDLLFYENFKEEFGENVSLVVGFSAPNVFSADVLEFIIEQTEKIKNLQNVDEVISLSNVEHIIGDNSDFLVEKLVQEIPKSTEDQLQLQKNALDSSLIRGSLVNPDSQTTMFLILPTSNVDSPASDAELVQDVKTIFSEAKSRWPQFEPRYAGGILTRLSLTQSTNRDMLVFMPLTYLLLVVLVYATLRNRWLVFLSILNISLCLVWTLGILHMIGGSMSPMTSILPPLIMALAVSDAIHVFTEFLRQDRLKTPLTEAIRNTLKILAVPCFLTSLTTAIGFLSLGISDIPPIQHFGIAAAAGMMVEFALTVTVLPLGIYFLRNKNALKTEAVSKTSRLDNGLKRLGTAIPRYRHIILFSSALLVALSILSSTFIEVETNLLEYFKKDSPVYQDAIFVDQRLGGTETLEVSVQTLEPDQLLDPQVLQMIEGIEHFLSQQPIISHVSSINDFFREMNKAFHNNDPEWFKLPDSRELAAQYLLLYDGQDIESILDSAHQWTHIAARIDVHSSKQIQELIDKTNDYIAQNTSGLKVNARLTGQVLIANKLIDYIVESQVESLIMAFALIFLVMLRIFKSIKLGIISIIPNSLPILFNFAVMGATGIPLNSATAIIAAVAIGIAVDDTIHFLHAYQVQKENKASTEKSLQIAIIQKGTPLISTSLILAGGFGILLAGSFIPTIQFGFLVSMIMIFAVLSDLIILPCLLLLLDPDPKQLRSM